MKFDTRDDYYNSIIAQDDDCDYSESGYVAVVKGNEAAIGRYSHCSCYGTIECLEGSDDTFKEKDLDLTFTWEGDVKGLIRLAKNKLDPDMPERKANKEDYDYDHLMKVYEEILLWNKNERNKK